MNIDILNDETWKRLTRSAETIPDNWSKRCAGSIREEKREVEKRYGIRIGQTEIYCARCGKSWAFGNHSCQDIRLERFRGERDEKTSELKNEKDKTLGILKDLGPKKAAIYLMVPERTVTNWIQRESVPQRYVDRVMNL